MDEFATISRARRFLKEAGSTSVPVDLGCLAAAANAKIKVVHDLRDDESGQTTRLGGRRIIVVNGNHRAERQRFTVLHELGHIVLGLPSRHGGPTLRTETLLGYRGRPEEEMLCDVFAAECLLPYELFGREVADSDISMEAVKSFARAYEASLTATGSRFALNANAPCAFVLSEAGRVRYVSRSKYLKELKGWIGFKTPIPRDSVAGHLVRDGSKIEDYGEIAADVWFDGGIRNRPLVEEESIVLREWNQCLSLLWFDESLSPVREGGNAESDAGRVAQGTRRGAPVALEKPAQVGARSSRHTGIDSRPDGVGEGPGMALAAGLNKVQGQPRLRDHAGGGGGPATRGVWGG